MNNVIERRQILNLLRRHQGRMADLEDGLFHHERIMHQEPIADIPERRKERSERIIVDGDNLRYNAPDEKVGVYIAAQPFTPEHNYFEIEILDTGDAGAIAVGLVHPRYPLDRQPGWNTDSVAYHADDGKLFKANGSGRSFGPKCCIGDRMGCGIKFDQIQREDNPRHLVPVFFTRNGKEIGTLSVPIPVDGFFPAVGMHSEGEEVVINSDAEWHYSDEILMSVDDCEEEWSRLHDIRLNGQILEYTGRGKSIVDVGLAQAKLPLDTAGHYFEIEIVDPGENCYIAIGLARRDYPKHRHPGWNWGSIAYHADDGKIFIGSGIGDKFGPRCQKGDIMGCGILFPRDYSSEHDSDEQDMSPEEMEVNNVYAAPNYASSDSDDEEWWVHRHHMDGGTKVKVFFTRNGKTIGSREVKVPKGGFYPTVGMLSSDEKVRVDLRPLTG
ncbi:SPRY domain-containing protein 3 isoform X2 [Lingula anatina]|nr:SPRY domain-containing protein 3 isoform X2 [Lingula anatina]|eukprot:XP_013390022.1 SPRY domain-containing protein 3 isoform X2 [Lingula anatina]